MKTIDHALKIACRVFPDGTKIDVHTHDDADTKSCNNMKKVGKIKSTEAKKAFDGNFRI